jgi:phosphoglycerate dehydrogenase-like enzyme
MSHKSRHLAVSAISGRPFSLPKASGELVGSLEASLLGGGIVKVVFGEPDKMFRLIAEALAPSSDGKLFLEEFYLTECDDPVSMLRAWSSRRQIPSGITVSHCSRPEDLKAMLTDADVLVIENGKVGTEELGAASSLKLIHTFGLVADNIDYDACRAHGIAVRKLDRHSNRMVAEHVLMLMLALTRGLDAAREGLRREISLQPTGWAYNWPATQGINGLTGRIVGLVGLGQVGALVARYLQPFGVKTLYTKRNRDRAAENSLGITYATLEELVTKSDILSLHIPGNAQTDRMVNAELLARAKPGMLIVNTARGSIIDEDALVNALHDGTICGAGLDVFASEPLRSDHPLRGLKNVILTPHVAAGTRDEAWLDREIGPLVDSVVSALKNC